MNKLMSKSSKVELQFPKSKKNNELAYGPFYQWHKNYFLFNGFTELSTSDELINDSPLPAICLLSAVSVLPKAPWKPPL